MQKWSKDQSATDARRTDELRWEFVRRDPEYIARYAEWTELRDSILPKAEKVEGGWKLNDDTVSGEEVERYVSRIDTGRGLPDEQRAYREEMLADFGLIEIADPDSRYDDFRETKISGSDGYLINDKIPTSTDAVSIIFPESRNRALPHLVASIDGSAALKITIDLTWPTEEILRQVKELVDSVKDAAEDRFVENRRLRLKKWEEYIEVYDMREDGMTYSDIADVIYKRTDGKGDPPTSNTVEHKYKAAQKQINGGHRTINKVTP